MARQCLRRLLMLMRVYTGRNAPPWVVVVVVVLVAVASLVPACSYSETHLVNGYNKFFYKLKLVISIVLALLCVAVHQVLCHRLVQHLEDARYGSGNLCVASGFAFRQILVGTLLAGVLTSFNYVKHFGPAAPILISAG